MCLDDDTDPINSVTQSGGQKAATCVGNEIAQTFNQGGNNGPSYPPAKAAGIAPEEAAGKFEIAVNLDAEISESFGGTTVGGWNVNIDGYTEVVLHFNKGAFSTVAFFQPFQPPDVSVAKTPDEPSNDIDAGQNAVFGITVTSNGPGAAPNVMLSDTLPTGFTWTPGGTNAADCSIASGVLTCNFGTLAPGATRSITLTAPTTTSNCGTITNTVTVSATGDVNAANNTNSGEIDVICGAIRILKNSTKGGPVNNAGAVFSVDGPDAGTDPDFSVTDATTTAGTDQDADIGEIWVSGLIPGATYTVNETTAPTGYGAATQTNLTVVAVAGECSSGSLNAATFTNAPLGEIVIHYNDLGSNETSAKIDCAGQTPTPPDGTPSAHDDDTETYTNLRAGNPPIVYTCTISVDP